MHQSSPTARRQNIMDETSLDQALQELDSTLAD